MVPRGYRRKMRFLKCNDDPNFPNRATFVKTKVILNYDTSKRTYIFTRLLPKILLIVFVSQHLNAIVFIFSFSINVCLSNTRRSSRRESYQITTPRRLSRISKKWRNRKVEQFREAWHRRQLSFPSPLSKPNLNWKTISKTYFISVLPSIPIYVKTYSSSVVVKRVNST